MTRQQLLVTTVVTLICSGILVLFTDLEQPLLSPASTLPTAGAPRR